MDAAVTATIQVVLETLISLASDRISSVLGFKEELKRLSKSAARIRGFLADADKNMHNEGVKDWLKQLGEVVFEAEIVLEEVNYENLRREVKYRSQLKRKVCFFFSFFSTISFRSRLTSKIRDINTNLERINKEANDVGLVFRFQIETIFPASDGASTSRQTHSIAVPNVVGRVDDELKIVEMLLSPSEKPVSVIPIFGMPGLGKTTLAKSIYNNPQIKTHFGIKVWVCVAKPIEIMDLFKLILVSSTREMVGVDNMDDIVQNIHRVGVDNMDMDAIVQNIQKIFREKRFFLVLDDVWDDDDVLWNNFLTTLGGLGATNGSWCLVTTRLQQVAKTVSTVDPHELGKIDDYWCWSILIEKVIGDKEVPKELEEIREQLLRRCDGVPLAAILIGGLLRRKRKGEWQSIVKESLFKEDQSGIKQILEVSFDHLSPASVRMCFAYCSIFPQDTKLKKDLLIECWMAEGFLQPEPNERLMEAIGDKNLIILLQSSLLEEVTVWEQKEEVTESEQKTYYKMHDLVHDFAKSVLNPESYLALRSSEGIAENIIKKTSVRTLFLESGKSSGMLSKFEYLHVLKLSGADVNELPTFIGKLIHLRLLDISYSKIKIFPESLGKLYNLQTLRIDDDILDCAQGGFPKQMRNLISLRHLHYYDSRAEFQMPLEIGRLTCLQTLKFFNVGKEKGRGIEELRSLKDLKGELVIRNLELVNGKQVAEQAKLSEKPNLCRLVFEWVSQDRDGDNCDDDVLEGLQPHPNLKTFAIRNFMGENFPQQLMNLPSLVKLELTNCNRLSELPALGQLAYLEILTLTKLEKIECMGVSFYGININDNAVEPTKLFPALKYLHLKDMENLEEWKGAEDVSSAIGEAQVILFPVLETLRIENCSKLTSAPCLDFQRIEELEIRNDCHVLLVEKIVSNITTVAEVYIDGDSMDEVHDLHQHIGLLKLVMPRDRESCLRLEGCGSEMIAHLCPSLPLLCHLPSLQQLEARNCHVSLVEKILSNITTLSGLVLLSDDTAEVYNSHQDIKRLTLNKRRGKHLEVCGNLPMIERLCPSLPHLCHLPSLEYLQATDCHISLLEKILSNRTTPSVLDLMGNNNFQTIRQLILKMTYGKLGLQVWGNLPMIERLCTSQYLCHLPSLEYLQVRDCHVSLVKKLLSNIITLSVLKLTGGIPNPYQHIRQLNLDVPGGTLELEDCVNLPGEMIEHLCHFSSLKHLRVWSCPNLTTLRNGCGTCLEELELSVCENLRELPEDLYKCQALRKLDIRRCPKINQLVIPVKGQKSLLTSLEELSIWDCDGLTCLPLEMLESCTSLRRMEVILCANLITNMPKGFAFLTSLEVLVIGPFTDYSSINELDWNGLRSSSTLTSLSLAGSPGIESLPDQLQYLTTLTELRLEYFGIEALPDWLGNLTSLETLTLRNCQRLQYLFSEDARTRLTKLTSLDTPGCTLLEER